MRRSTRMTLLPLALSLCSGYGHAETLDEAWAAALAASPALAAQTQQVAAAQARQEAAQALNWPTLSLSAAAVHLSQPPTTSIDLSPLGTALAPVLGSAASLLPSSLSMPLTDSNVSLGQLALTYPLYTGGRITSTQHAAEANLKSNQAQTDKTRQDLKLNVAEAYLNVQRADAAADVARQYRDSLIAHRDDVKAMERQGLAAPVERMTADVAVADADRQLIDARQATELSRAAYNRLLARPLTQPVQLSPLADGPAPDLSPEAADKALNQRPELQALQSGQTALREQARAQRGEDGPQIAAQAAYLRWNGLPTTDNHTSTIGVVLNWNLFDGGLNKGKSDALAAEAASMADKQRDAESMIRLDVLNAQLGNRSAAERLGVATAAEALAEESLRLTRLRYQNAQAIQTEVLAAETRLADARRARTNAHFDVQLARLRLLRAMGEL